MLESQFQSQVKLELHIRFPGCEVTKQNANKRQGLPDLHVRWYERWAMLEIKADAKSPRQPNQPYYIEKYNRMGFAAFIHPGNFYEVMRELEEYFNQ